MNKTLLFASTIVAASLFTSIAQASCISLGGDTRLKTFCLATSMKDKLVIASDAVILDAMLKGEGYANGVGLAYQFRPNIIKSSLSPIVDYDTNINGGNPDELLILGTYQFSGDPDFIRKSGSVFGVGANIDGRNIYGEGRYFDYALNSSYIYSPNHKIGVNRLGASFCSKNHIKNHWYVDICGDSSRSVRELSKDINNSLSLSATKLLSPNARSFHSANTGIRRQFFEGYEQDHLFFGLSSIRNNGPYTSLNMSFGEGVPNQLAVRNDIQAKIGTKAFGRQLTATVGYSYADGGKILGFERHDTSSFISLSLNISEKISVSLGYNQTKSNIDYFDSGEPSIGIHFAPIKF